jgi:hypothetical protein
MKSSKNKWLEIFISCAKEHFGPTAKKKVNVFFHD